MTPDSSTNMSVNGYAVRILKRRILEAAIAHRGQTHRGSFPPAFPDMNPEDLDIRDSVIYAKSDPSMKMTLSEFVGVSGSEGPISQSEMPALGLERTHFTLPLFAYGWQVQVGAYANARLRFCRQAHFMEVEVDTETGKVFVTKVVKVNDVGRVIS